MEPLIGRDELERKVEELGFELVEVEWAGHRPRPILRLRIDRPFGTPEDGVTVDECARVSRGLEPWLDAVEEIADNYVLEVSSPGIERPLVKDRDFTRFAGRRIAVRGPEPFRGKATYLEGELLGVDDAEDGAERIRLKLKDGDVLEIPRADIETAHLVHRFE